MATSTDYTREDDRAENYDDYEFGAVTAAKSVDQIEDENTFKQIPPGERILVVKRIAGPPEEKYIRVFVNGQQVGYKAAQIKVDFYESGKPENATAQDIFLLPPTDPREHQAYFEGRVNPENTKEKPGFQANKFLQFIARLGFAYPPGGSLPPEARRLRNWVGRTVKATIQPGEPYAEKDKQGNPTGKMKDGFNRIKLFSYEATGPATQPTASQSTAAQPTPAAPARSMAGVGLNDI